MHRRTATSRRLRVSRGPQPLYPLKVLIAKQLGLLEKVRAVGWAELPAAESGRVGGAMTKRCGRKPPRSLRLTARPGN